METGRILLKWKPHFIQHRTAGGSSFIADYSIVLLTAEEMIAAGATELIVDLNEKDIQNIEDRAPALRKRLIRAEGSKAASQAVSAILTPALQEHKIQNTLIYSFTYGEGTNREIADNLVKTAGFLYDFLIGARNKAIVDSNFEQFRETVYCARNQCRNLGARANLAAIEGLLAHYESDELTSIGLKMPASLKAVELFQQFVDDATYQQLSHSAHTMGLPDVVTAAKKNFSSLSESLVNSDKFTAETVPETLKIQTSASVPKIREKLLTNWMESGYVPPIVSFGHIQARALKQYDLLKPHPIWPDRVPISELPSESKEIT